MQVPQPAQGHSLDIAIVGDIIGTDGRAYDPADVNALGFPEGVSRSAIVAYVGSDTGEENFSHGLAISMGNTTLDGGMSKGFYGDNVWYSTSFDFKPDPVRPANPNTSDNLEIQLNYKESGFALSQNRDATNNIVGYIYPAFHKCTTNEIALKDDIVSNIPISGTSTWFMPSIFQWQQIVQGLSGDITPITDVYENRNSNYTTEKLNSIIEAAGGEPLLAGGYFSSSTNSHKGGCVWILDIKNGYVYYDYSYTSYRNRAVLAF